MKLLALALAVLLTPLAARAQYDPATNTFQSLSTLPAASLNTALAAAQARGTAAALAAVRTGLLSMGDATATNYDLFGAPMLRVATRGNRNAIVGIADNNVAPGTSSFPTGTTGYGNLTSAGGNVFGLFGRADLRVAGTATNEVNSFNYCGQPSGLLPPNTAFGTPECNAIPLQVIPYGNWNNSIGVLFGPGVNDAGTAPILFRSMIYARPNTFSDFGIFLDGSAADTAPAVTLVRGAAGQHITLRSVGPPAPTAPVMSYTNAAGQLTFAVRQNGEVSGHSVAMVPTAHASLPAPVAGAVAYCSDCFQSGSTTSRGTLVFGNGTSWMAPAATAAAH